MGSRSTSPKGSLSTFVPSRKNRSGGALTDAGLPHDSFLLAVLSFNGGSSLSCS